MSRLISKTFTLLLIVVFIGGLIAGVFLLPFLPWNRGQVSNKIIEEKIVTVPQAIYFTEAISSIEPSVVAIQAFSTGSLIRSGSGVILTRDGLIATLNSLVPAYAQTIQVINGDKISKAKVVWRSFNNNLAIISIAENELQVARLRSDIPTLGENLIFVSELFSFKQSTTRVESSLVSEVNQTKKEFRISAEFDPAMYGAALISGRGDVLGLIDYRSQKPVVLSVTDIEVVLNNALSRLTPTPNP